MTLTRFFFLCNYRKNVYNVRYFYVFIVLYSFEEISFTRNRRIFYRYE